MRIIDSDDVIEERLGELPYVDIAGKLELLPWFIPEFIPSRNVTLLSGEGAIGKSTLLTQLLGATVLSGAQWLGTFPENGPALYLTAEEEDIVIRHRLEAVADSLGTTRQRLKDNGLHVLSFAGKDATLGAPDRHGFIRPTPLFERIRNDCLRLKPKLIGFDAAADVFAGDEINRQQTRQFITLLRGLSMDTDSAVMLTAHPSLTGISSGSGLSGSTGWHNSVRARGYLRKAPGDDKSLRVLEVKKNNYGPEQKDILLRWRDGVYVVVQGEGSLEKLTEDARVDELFLKLLRRFAKQGRNVSASDNGPNRAPKMFAADPEAKATNTSKVQFEDAMARLFAAARIEVITDGRPSHPTRRIVETGGQGGQVIPFPTPANSPANYRPTPANSPKEGGWVSPPITPPESAGGVGTAAESGKRADRPAPADGSRPSVGSLRAESAATPPGATPIMAWEMDELKTRGFTPDDLFGISPERARAILADPECNKLTEKYGKGADAPPDTICRRCGKPGARYFSEPLGPGERPDRFPGMTALHLGCCPKYFESDAGQG